MAYPAREALDRATQLAGSGRLLASVEPGQQAAALALSAREWEIAGPALLSLASVFERLHRYRQQAALLKEALPLMEQDPEASAYLPAACYSLGTALYRTGDYDTATIYLLRAHKGAESLQQSELADRCRHLLRSICIHRGDAKGFRVWLSDSERYLEAHPEDHEALFHYWFDQAQEMVSKGAHARAVSKALRALRASKGNTEAEFSSLWLLHSCAMENGDWHDALQFAVGARISALEGRRPDLSDKTVDAILSLIGKRGAELLVDVYRHYATQGLDLFRYVPENLLSCQRNDRGAIGVVSEVFGAPARDGGVQTLPGRGH